MIRACGDERAMGFVPDCCSRSSRVAVEKESLFPRSSKPTILFRRAMAME